MLGPSARRIQNAETLVSMEEHTKDGDPFFDQERATIFFLLFAISGPLTSLPQHKFKFYQNCKVSSSLAVINVCRSRLEGDEFPALSKTEVMVEVRASIRFAESI
jgi:hypothetical protein